MPQKNNNNVVNTEVVSASNSSFFNLPEMKTPTSNRPKPFPEASKSPMDIYQDTGRCPRMKTQ